VLRPPRHNASAPEPPANYTLDETFGRCCGRVRELRVPYTIARPAGDGVDIECKRLWWSRQHAGTEGGFMPRCEREAAAARAGVRVR